MISPGQRVNTDGKIELYYTRNSKAAESSAEREIKGGVTRKMIEFEGSQGRGAQVRRHHASGQKCSETALARWSPQGFWSRTRDWRRTPRYGRDWLNKDRIRGFIKVGRTGFDKLYSSSHTGHLLSILPIETLYMTWMTINISRPIFSNKVFINYVWVEKQR